MVVQTKRKPHLRFHQDQPQCLHLLHPRLILLLESRDRWPLILTPNGFGFVRVLYWLVEIEPFVIIGFAVGNILLEPGIT